MRPLLALTLALTLTLHAATPIAWGPPDHGVRFGLAFGPSSPDPQIRLIFQNVDRPQCLLPLGSTSAKGPVYDVEFTLKAREGTESTLFNMNGPAGIQPAPKPIQISLNKGQQYEILLSMKKLIYIQNGKSLTLPEMLARHYSVYAVVDTTGEARYTRTRDQWMGRLVSGELRE